MSDQPTAATAETPAPPGTDVAALHAELAQARAQLAAQAELAQVAAPAPAPAAPKSYPAFATGERVRVSFDDVYDGRTTRTGVVFETSTVERADETGAVHGIPAVAVAWLEVSGPLPLDDFDVEKVG